MTTVTIPCMMLHPPDAILISILNLTMSASNNCVNLSCFVMISQVPMRQRRLLAPPRCIFAPLIEQFLTWVILMLQLL